MCFHQINRSTVALLLWHSISALEGKGLKDVFSLQMFPQATSTWCHAQHVARELQVKRVYSIGKWRLAIQWAEHVMQSTWRKSWIDLWMREADDAVGKWICAPSAVPPDRRITSHSLYSSLIVFILNTSPETKHHVAIREELLILHTTSIRIWTKQAMYV